MNDVIASFSNNFKSQITNYLNDIPFLNFYARFSGFIQRERKLLARETLLTLILASFRCKSSSLIETVSILKSVNPKITMSPQSFEERINNKNCCHFLKLVLADLLKKKILSKINLSEIKPTLLKSFSRVLIEDSSRCELSKALQNEFRGFGENASPSSVKINTVYDLVNAKFVHFSEHSGTKSDQTLGKITLDILEKSDLLIRDLGYLNIANLKTIEDKLAFYLSRLSGTVTIRLNKNDDPIPFKTIFNKYARNGCLDIRVFIGEEKLFTRLIAFQVPQNVGNERRRKLNKTSRHQGRKKGVQFLSFLKQKFLFHQNLFHNDEKY